MQGTLNRRRARRTRARETRKTLALPRFFFLFGLGNNISLALGLLLGDLLLLDGAAELLAKYEMRDRHVIQNDVEVVGALRERRADLGPVRLCVSV